MRLLIFCLGVSVWSSVQAAQNVLLIIADDKLVPPVITNFTRVASQFSVTVPRGTNLAYRLWKAATLDDLAWAPLTNALVVTNGTTTVTLTDTNAMDTAQFYRVEARRR